MIDWNNEPLLGLVCDITLARKYGVSDGAVRCARNIRGIPAFDPFQGAKQKILDSGLLGTMPDTHLAKKLDVPLSAVRRFRSDMPTYHENLADQIRTHPLLGKVPDTQLAGLINCPAEATRTIRIEAGLPACTVNRGKVVEWGLETDLGKVPDAVLARRHGVGYGTVRKARMRRGLPKFIKPTA